MTTCTLLCYKSTRPEALDHVLLRRGVNVCDDHKKHTGTTQDTNPSNTEDDILTEHTAANSLSQYKNLLTVSQTKHN